jgi:hypothetical protein
MLEDKLCGKQAGAQKNLESLADARVKGLEVDYCYTRFASLSTFSSNPRKGGGLRYASGSSLYGNLYLYAPDPRSHPSPTVCNFENHKTYDGAWGGSVDLA